MLAFMIALPFVRESRYYNFYPLVVNTMSIQSCKGGFRQTVGMPKYTRPADSDFMEDPIHALGNMLRARIIGHVRQHGPVQRQDLVLALGVGSPAVSKALKVLVDTGVLIPSPAEFTRGTRVTYTVDEDVVREMWFRLGDALGQT